MPSSYSTKLRKRRNPAAALTPPDGWVVTDSRRPDPRGAVHLYPTRSEARTASEMVFWVRPVTIWAKRGSRYEAVWRSLEDRAPQPYDQHGRTYYPTIRRRNWK